MPKHKYHAKPQITLDGRFDSKRELKRWEQLKQLQANGTISQLSRAKADCTFGLHGADGSVVCKYIVDYIYLEDGRSIAEDAKGMKTAVYRLKRKLFIAEHGSNWTHRES